MSQWPSFLAVETKVSPPPAHAMKENDELPQAKAKQLDLTIHTQDQDLWCWAACTSSIAAYDKPGSQLTQCRVASLCLNKVCCPKESACNTTFALDTALERTNQLAEPKKLGHQTKSFIQTEIDATRPLGIWVKRAGNVGHFMVLHGYDWNSGDVTLSDPLTGTRDVIPWKEFTSLRPRCGFWKGSYQTKRA